MSSSCGKIFAALIVVFAIIFLPIKGQTQEGKIFSSEDWHAVFEQTRAHLTSVDYDTGTVLTVTYYKSNKHFSILVNKLGDKDVLKESRRTLQRRPVGVECAKQVFQIQSDALGEGFIIKYDREQARNFLNKILLSPTVCKIRYVTGGRNVEFSISSKGLKDALPKFFEYTIELD